MTILIFVALQEELEVLCNHLHLTKQVGNPVAMGEIEGVQFEVLCPRNMGRVPAAVEVASYLSSTKSRPNMILCVGLAGGFVEAQIDAGTVICADTVVDLANRKVADNQEGVALSSFRRRDFDCSRAIYEYASTEFNIEGWSRYCQRNFDWPNGRIPSLREGKIASVDEVVASDEHRRKMIDSVDKLLGVEMEAGGVCAAAKPFSIPVAVLRVVSDMADPSKRDDAWRIRGMKALAELIKRINFDRIATGARH